MTRCQECDADYPHIDMDHQGRGAPGGGWFSGVAVWKCHRGHQLYYRPYKGHLLIRRDQLASLRASRNFFVLYSRPTKAKGHPMPSDPNNPPIESLLVREVSRTLVLAVEEALDVGGRRAYEQSKGMSDGHLPHVIGQLRHFNSNETFEAALAANGGEPSALKGNKLVVGRAGIFCLARMSMRLGGNWSGTRRSVQRRLLARANEAIELLDRPDMFAAPRPVTTGTVFFISTFARTLLHSPERPVEVHIAVPDSNLRSWLFIEPIRTFLTRYAEAAPQPDLAKPKLKVPKKTDQPGNASDEPT